MLACRPMLCFAFAVIVGAVAARRFPEAAAVPYGWAAFALLLVHFLFLSKPAVPEPPPLPDGYAEHILARPGFLARRGLNRFIIVVCIGLFLASFPRYDLWKEKFSPERLPQNRWFDANLLALGPCREHPAEDGVWRVPALLLTADGNDVGRFPVRLSGPEGALFRRGDMIQCRVRVDSTPVRAYPGAFDVALWLERDGIAASLTVVKPWRGKKGKGGETPAYVVVAVEDAPIATRVRRLVDSVRSTAIMLTMRHGGEYGGVLSAMLYGYRKDLGTELRDSFRRVGIGHVLAISGLHVGLIVWLLWWLSGWINWTSRARAIACLVLAVFYLGLSGGQVAASRATLMAVIHLAGIAWGRRGDMLNSLGAAAFFLVLANPSAPFDVSFQLSFTAVVFIYMGLHRERRQDAKPAAHKSANPIRRRAVNELASLTRLSIATWVGLFPIIAAIFNQVNLVGLPINLIVIPLMGLVLGGGLLLPLLGWIPGAGFVLTLPERALERIAFFSDKLPLSSFPAHAPSPYWVVLFYLFVFLALLRGMIKSPSFKRRWTLASYSGMALAFVLMAFSMHSAPPPAGGRISVLPGRGFGVIAVESEKGGIALLGTFARSGFGEAGWLHFQRRGGEVAVVAVEETELDELSALSYHYRIATLTRTPLADKEAVADNDWRPVEGVPEIEYALSRDSRGRIVWVAARTGGRSVCVMSRAAPRQLTWRIENRTPGFDADLLCVDFQSGIDGPPGPLPEGSVAVSGQYGGEYPEGWFDRRKYGALTLEGALRGFDGREWKGVGK